MSKTAPNDHYQLDTSQIESFAANGHLLLRAVASEDELARYEPAIREACKANSKEERDLNDRDTYGKAFLQVTNLWTHDDIVREFVFKRRFARLAAELLCVPHVRLYHDQALFKEPGGGPTPWHQDQFYWPLDTDRTITMWMPLVDVTENMGTMTFASGSHRNGAVNQVPISDESERFYLDYVRESNFPVTTVESMRAGDATFHHGWTMHSAGANRTTDQMREVMTVIYFAADARVSAPQNDNQRADLDAWLDSKRPGEAAEGHLNPVLA